MDLTGKKTVAKFIILFSMGVIILAMILATWFSKNLKTSRSHAQVTDCTADSGSMDYCGDTAPFRGCVGGVGGNEWLCMCRLKSGKWWSECSIIEDTGKQKWIDNCGGDKEKAFMQWKYDVAILETRGECSCGGQNICPLPETQKPPSTQQPPTSENPITYEINPPTDSPPTPTTQVLRPNQPTIDFLNQQRVFPTETTTEPQTLKSEFNFPQFQFPNLNFNIDTRPVGQAINTSLGFFENIFYKIKYYDASLENYINNLIRR